VWVGRQQELASVRAALSAWDRSTNAGSVLVVEIVGDPGIGKSSMLARICGEAGRMASTTLIGQASDTVGGAPLGALVDAMDDFLVTRRRDCGSTLPKRDLAALAGVFPALAGYADGPVERYEVYRGVRVLLEWACGPRGLVLALDDLHWADPAVLEALAYLARRPPRGRLVLVLAYRPRQVDPRLPAMFAATSSTTVRLGLGPLTEADTADLLGPEIARSRVTELHQVSGGNPFHLEALTTARTVPDLGPDGPGELPGPVRAVLRAEVAALSRSACRAVAAASVIGDPFDAEVVAEVAGLELGQTIRALDEAHARDLIRPHPPSGFIFRHALLRQVTYDSSPVGWRRDAHARTARAMRRRGDPLARCAPHVARSATVGDWGAIGLLRDASDEVRTRAPAVAATLLGEALRLLPADQRGSTADFDLEIRLAHSLALAGRLQEARESSHRLLHGLAADQDRRLTVLLLAVRVDLLLGHHVEARAMVVHELGIVGDPRVRTALQLDLVLSGLLGGRGAEDRSRLEAVWRMAVELGDPALQARAAGLVALLSQTIGAVSAARAAADSAAALVDALPDDTLTTSIEALVYLGFTEMLLERFHASLRHYQRGLRLARRTGQQHFSANIHSGIALNHLWLGPLDVAAQYADDAVAAAELCGSDDLRCRTYDVQAMVAYAQGDLPVAARASERAVASGGTVRSWASSWAALHRAAARVQLGEGTAAWDDAVEFCGGPRLPYVGAAGRPHVMRVPFSAALARGDLDGAQDWADRMAEAARPLGLPCRTALVALSRGQLALARGDAAKALMAARSAAGAFAAAGARPELAWALLLSGRALAARDRRGAALVDLTRARELAATVRADRLHDETTRELRQLGTRVAPRRPAGTAAPKLEQLTARENEIGALVAEGLTNPQIAERLVLSTRTVDAHLRNIFTKLDVATRAAVAAAITGGKGQRRSAA
jgi:DNA-binding CsgD family transcriptional regulator/tetratricopeptide (TPR) repeat protein